MILGNKWSDLSASNIAQYLDSGLVVNEKKKTVDLSNLKCPHVCEINYNTPSHGS